MEKLIVKWRKRKFDIPENYPWFSLNWEYSLLSFEFIQTRKWYVDNCWLSVDDTLLDNKYTDGTTENPRKDRLLAIVNYDETKISFEDLAYDLENNVNATYSTRVLTIEETRQFLNDYTTCNKIDNWDGTFDYTISDETTVWEITTPAYILTI